MQVLVIGGSGYVGPSVTSELQDSVAGVVVHGWDAGWFAHQIDGGGPIPERSCERFTFRDVRDLDSSDLEGMSGVIYLSAISNDPMGDRFRELTFEINQRQAVRIATLAKAQGARNFVFASSASVYGRGAGDRFETDPLDPQTAYAESKIRAERELEPLADSRFAVTCLRFATACGWSPRVRLDLVLNDFVAKALTTGSIEVLSDGSPWRPLIHVKDMARAIGWSLDDARGECSPFVTVNVGSSEWNFQIRDLAHAVADELGGISVSVNADAAPDTRSYRLDFSQWRAIAPHHQPQVSLPEAIQDLATNLRPIPDLNPDFRRSPRVRLHQLEAWIASGYLDGELRWKR